MRRTVSHYDRKNQGSAAVELAVCLPVVVIIAISGFEAAHFLHLKQTLTLAAYETAAAAGTTGKTEADALACGTMVLQSRETAEATISISPSITAATAPGTEITVTVSAPASSNSAGLCTFTAGTTVRCAVTVTRN